jgi:hypothetical protein
LDREQELDNGAKAVAVPPAPQPAPAGSVFESVDRMKMAKKLLWEGYPAKPL